jgi:hypothetical protein
MSPIASSPAPGFVAHARHSVVRGALLALACGAAGCEWVLDGIPHAQQAAVDGGGTPGVLPGQADGGQGFPDAGTLPIDGNGPLPGFDGPVDAGALPGFDGSVDAAPPPPPCMAGMSVYRDIDGDGFGTGVPITLACPPAFAYSAETGDCNDDDADVFPGQTRFFGTAYKAPDGSRSFDYDCSGAEDGNGKQAVLGACGALGALLCSGKGYVATSDRFPAFGINTTCGSTTLQECRAELIGTASCRAFPVAGPAEPYLCR